MINAIPPPDGPADFAKIERAITINETPAVDIARGTEAGVIIQSWSWVRIDTIYNSHD